MIRNIKYHYCLSRLISDNVIKTTKVLLDKTGGLRVYVSQELEDILEWKNHEEVVLKVESGRLLIFPTSMLKVEAPA